MKSSSCIKKDNIKNIYKEIKNYFFYLEQVLFTFYRAIFFFSPRKFCNFSKLTDSIAFVISQHTSFMFQRIKNKFENKLASQRDSCGQSFRSGSLRLDQGTCSYMQTVGLWNLWRPVFGEHTGEVVKRDNSDMSTGCHICHCVWMFMSQSRGQFWEKKVVKPLLVSAHAPMWLQCLQMHHYCPNSEA